MTKLRLLMKLQSLSIFRVNEIRFTRDKKQKRRLILLLSVYIFLGLLFVFYAAMMAWALWRLGAGGLLPAGALLFSSLACLMLSVIRTPALLFHQTGWDSLLALPFTRQSLIGAKLLNLCLSGLALSFAIIVPFCAFYFLSQGANSGRIIVWLCLLLFSPLIPLSFGMALAAIPTILFQRLKNRSLLSALLLVPLITWLMLKIYTLPMDNLDSMDLMKTLVGGIEAVFLSTYPPMGWILSAMQGDFVSLIKFIALNLAVMAIAWLALVLLHPRLQQALTSVRLRRAKKHQHTVRSPLWALTLKEGRRMASSPLYLMNTGMALWLAPMALFLFPFVKPGFIDTLITLPPVQNLMARYLPLMACAMSALTVPATVSISIEGKNAWLMCTAPVSAGTMLLSKALFSVLFCLPPVLLTAILLMVHLKLSIALCLICFILPLSLSAFSSVMGLMFDLRFARFDWENEQQIIKNSAQTGLGLLSGLLSMALLFAALYFAPKGSTLVTSYLLALGLTLAATLLFKRLSKENIYQIK